MHKFVLALFANALAPVAARGSASAVAARGNARANFCGTIPVNAQFNKADKSIIRRGDLGNATELRIDVYMHVIARPEENKHNKTEFLLSRNDLEKQIDVLNKSFKPAKIYFSLKSVDWVVENLTSYYSKSLKGLLSNQVLKSLQKGNRSALNLYFYNATDDVGGITGWPTSTNGEVSGCIVSSNTVPGGANLRWNMGKTAVHEVGHWLGYDWHTDLGVDCGYNEHNCAPEPECVNYMARSNDTCIFEFNSDQNLLMHNFLEKLQQNSTPLSFMDLAHAKNH
ncbi:hypothetical protein QQS21_012865 [Conoideocrella luteorostrata]|uniref:Metalloprotease n=1 Tax=Conoideocrella luteorostrata TaxID=1105319 RepID=A0AAJ0CD83_9HYPO|nr:hypothetical protein QQS21_012865 [Conoideocrella luteorostrata]